MSINLIVAGLSSHSRLGRRLPCMGVLYPWGLGGDKLAGGTGSVSGLWINLCLTPRGFSSRKLLFLPKVLLVSRIESHR